MQQKLTQQLFTFINIYYHEKEIFILLTASLVASSCVDNEDIYKKSRQ